jgi:hypothetical protein
MKKIYLIIAIIIGSFIHAKAQQQVDPLKENMTFDIDNLGDGKITVSMTYNASQWDNFQKIYGSNALNLLKRQMERSLPAYYLQGWEYKEDPATRTYNLSFQALGLAKIDDNGNWVIDLDQKKPDITKMSDHNYAMTTTYNSYGVLVQELIKINLPDGATNITQDKNAFGKAVFTYELSPGHKGSRWIFLGLAALLIAAGVVFYFKPDILSMGKQKAVKPFTVLSAQPAPAAIVTPEPPVNPNIEKQA